MLKLRRRLRLSQNFLRNRILVRELVRRSSIGSIDLVLEIGPGEGIITRELLAVARRVVAVELDDRLYCFLKKNFCGNRNLIIHQGDALRAPLPHGPYKVFANIPFAIEGRLIRRLLHSSNPPDDCYLVVRKSVAERLAGLYREGLFSILHKPWFDFEITYRFRPSDFAPATLVQPVLLRITKGVPPLIARDESDCYRQFITQAFGGGRRLKQNLRRLMTPGELHQAAQKLGFSVDAMPSELTFNQWIALFQTWRNGTTSSAGV